VKLLQVTVISAVLVTAGASPAQAATVDWAQAGYAATNTSYNPSESVINSSSIAQLKARWAATPKPGTAAAWP
jgi:outer membrane protein assembly factor BamB